MKLWECTDLLKPAMHEHVHQVWLTTTVSADDMSPKHPFTAGTAREVHIVCMALVDTALACTL